MTRHRTVLVVLMGLLLGAAVACAPMGSPPTLEFVGTPVAWEANPGVPWTNPTPTRHAEVIILGMSDAELLLSSVPTDPTFCGVTTVTIENGELTCDPGSDMAYGYCYEAPCEITWQGPLPATMTVFGAASGTIEDPEPPPATTTTTEAPTTTTTEAPTTTTTAAPTTTTTTPAPVDPDPVPWRESEYEELITAGFVAANFLLFAAGWVVGGD